MTAKLTPRNKVKYDRSTNNVYRVQSYLKPRIYMMFIAEKDTLYRKESEHAAQIITKHFESMPESNQRHLVELYQKQNPKK